MDDKLFKQYIDNKILELFKDFKPELPLNISDIQTFNIIHV